MNGGARPLCSDPEARWLREMEVIGTIREPYAVSGPERFFRRLIGRPRHFPGREQPRNALEFKNWDAVEAHAEAYVRRLPADSENYYGLIGLAPGRAALISVTEALLIIPAADIEAFVIESTTPGRSCPSGGRKVCIRGASANGGASPPTIDLRFGDEAVAIALAKRLGKPVERIEFSGD